MGRGVGAVGLFWEFTLQWDSSVICNWNNLSWNFTGNCLACKHEYTLINLCKLAFQMIRADEMIKSAVLISSILLLQLIEHVTFNLLTYKTLARKTGSEEPGI